MRPSLASIVAAAAAAAVLALPSAPRCSDDADSARRRYEDIQKEIKLKESILSQTKKKEEATLAELHETSRRLLSLKNDLEKYRGELDAVRKDAEKTRGEIELLEEKISKRRLWLSAKLRAMHRQGRTGGLGEAVVLLASSRDFSEAMRRWRYLEALAAYERGMIEGYTSDAAALKAKYSEIKTLQARLQEEEKRVRDAEEDYRLERRRKEEILTSVRKKKEDYEQMLKDLASSSSRLLSVIKDSERSSSRYKGSAFRGLKGKLPWPVEGRVLVPYGSQEDPVFKTPVFRNGIYIAARDGSVVRAALDGEVVYADWFKGYGQVVIIDHGSGYHTLYANLSEIFLKTGDIIKVKDGIGRVGESGILEKPSLYFEVRYKGKPLNPEQWLEDR